MYFGTDFLPKTSTDWTLDSATLVAGVLTIQAGGSAVLTLDTPFLAMIPEAFKLVVFADYYDSRAKFELVAEYDEGDYYYAVAPVIDNPNGTIIMAGVGTYTSFTITISATATIIINTFQLSAGIVDMASAMYAYGLKEGFFIDEFGMDTRFIKWFKNMCNNSSFEVRNSDGSPKYWIGGLCVNDVNFFGTWSCKLEYGETTVQEERVNPTWYASMSARTRIAFHKKGGNTRVSILDVNGDPVMLRDNSGVSAIFFDFAFNENWIAPSYTLVCANDAHISLRLKFECIDETYDSYIDAVIIEPDYTGRRPSFYTDGPHSVAAENGEELELLPIIYVQDDEPENARVKDIWIDTDDYTRYDLLNVSESMLVNEDDPEVLVISNTSETIVLTKGTFLHTAGIQIKIFDNRSDYVVLLVGFPGYIDRVCPGESLVVYIMGLS
jgi:hypothetical protein